MATFYNPSKLSTAGFKKDDVFVIEGPMSYVHGSKDPQILDEGTKDEKREYAIEFRGEPSELKIYALPSASDEEKQRIKEIGTKFLNLATFQSKKDKAEGTNIYKLRMPSVVRQRKNGERAGEWLADMARPKFMSLSADGTSMVPYHGYMPEAGAIIKVIARCYQSGSKDKPNIGYNILNVIFNEADLPERSSQYNNRELDLGAAFGVDVKPDPIQENGGAEYKEPDFGGGALSDDDLPFGDISGDENPFAGGDDNPFASSDDENPFG